MNVKDLIEEIRNISGYKSMANSRTNSSSTLVNDNMIYKGINEASKFIDAEIMPSAYAIPLNIDVETDIIGGDLIKLKLSSYNSGSLPTGSVPWKDMAHIPWKRLATGIDSIDMTQGKYDYENSFGRQVETDINNYLDMCSMRTVGTMSVNRIKSSTIINKYISTLKTVFIIKDSKGKYLDEYSVTTDTNAFSFSTHFIDININYEEGIITASYRGSDAGEYFITVSTLDQPSGVLFYKDGVLRTSKYCNYHTEHTVPIRLRPYALYDSTQKIPTVYTNDLLNILSYRGALEVQRFNRSMDQNLVNITYGKVSDYVNKERFKTVGKINNIRYF